MSIIWDEKNKEHIVYESGIEKARISSTDFPVLDEKATCEEELKVKMDVKLATHHTRMHVFDKPDIFNQTKAISYVVWMGEVGTAPWGGAKEWWIDGPPFEPPILLIDNVK